MGRPHGNARPEAKAFHSTFHILFLILSQTVRLFKTDSRGTPCSSKSTSAASPPSYHEDRHCRRDAFLAKLALSHVVGVAHPQHLRVVHVAAAEHGCEETE